MRLFAVIPAAGLSRRMGRPKLLLPVAGRTVIERLLAVLEHPLIIGRYVVLRPDDGALRAEVERCGGTAIVPPEPPPTMRDSVAAGLAAIVIAHSPTADDGWLMIPGDHPQLSPATLARLLDVWTTERPDYLVPAFRGGRGHPLIARWSTTQKLSTLPSDVGINHLLRDPAHPVRELELDDDGVVRDLDTPDDYARLLDDITEAPG